MLGIIGGSGFYQLGRKVEEEDVITPYGDARIERIKFFRKKEIIFIPRHGKRHEIPPHKINYRANIYALKKLGVDAVFSTHAAGIISKYKVGDLVLLEDFLGPFTPITFYDDFSAGIKHIDFSRPFDKRLSTTLLAIGRALKIPIKKGGIIATMPGPRFETKAEIKMLKTIGANLVSMTNAYEATLIGELEIPYVSLAVATNYAAGVKKGNPLSHDEVISVMTKAKKKVNAILHGLIKELL